MVGGYQIWRLSTSPFSEDDGGSLKSRLNSHPFEMDA